MWIFIAYQEILRYWICTEIYKEIKIKNIQGCNEIFLSYLEKINLKLFRCFRKFNLINIRCKKNLIALGDINEKNYKKLKLLKIKGFAVISWAEKKRPERILGRFKFNWMN